MLPFPGMLHHSAPERSLSIPFSGLWFLFLDLRNVSRTRSGASGGVLSSLCRRDAAGMPPGCRRDAAWMPPGCRRRRPSPRQYVRIGCIGESPWNDPARLLRQTRVEACLPDAAYGNPHAEKSFIILKLRKARCVGNKSKKKFFFFEIPQKIAVESGNIE